MKNSRLVKCRLCHFKEDDPERVSVVGVNLVQDENADLYYYVRTQKFEPAVKKVYFGAVSCPTFGCRKLMTGSKKDMPRYFVRTEPSEQYDFIPMGNSVCITDVVEERKIACRDCKHRYEEPSLMRIAYVIYSNVMHYLHTGEYEEDCEPWLMVECKDKECARGFQIPPPKGIMKGVVEVEPSKLLRLMNVFTLGPNMCVSDSKPDYENLQKHLSHVMRKRVIVIDEDED